MKKLVLLVLLAVIALGWSNISYAQYPECDQQSLAYDLQKCYRLTTGQGNIYTSRDFFDIMESIAGFLISAAGIIAGAVIIVAGLMYMSAGSNQTRVTSARTVFKNGVIGALILFAAGIIINTIAMIATNPFNFFT